MQLLLEGNVINRPNQKASSAYTWPQGVPLATVLDHIQSFAKAFELKKVIYSDESRRVRCRTASELLGA